MNLPSAGRHRHGLRPCCRTCGADAARSAVAPGRSAAFPSRRTAHTIYTFPANICLAPRRKPKTAAAFPATIIPNSELFLRSPRGPYFSFRKKKSVRKSDRSPKHLCGRISALRRYRPCRAPARLRPLPCRTKICRANLSSVPIRFPQAKENLCTVSGTHNAARHKFFLVPFSCQEKGTPARRALLFF